MNYSIYLFGSYARGDQEENSDLDILIVWKDNLPRTDRLSIQIMNEYNKKPSISTYNIDVLKRYYADGHLFAWHLYLESMHLDKYSEFDCLALLGVPNQYRNASKDIRDFVQLLLFIQESILEGTRSVIFEAGNFYTVLRNLFFYYIYFRFGRMIFSPTAIYAYSVTAPVLESNYADYRMAKCLRSIGSFRIHELSYPNILADIESTIIWVEENLNGYLFGENRV